MILPAAARAPSAPASAASRASDEAGGGAFASVLATVPGDADAPAPATPEAASGKPTPAAGTGGDKGQALASADDHARAIAVAVAKPSAVERPDEGSASDAPPSDTGTTTSQSLGSPQSAPATVSDAAPASGTIAPPTTIVATALDAQGPTDVSPPAIDAARTMSGVAQWRPRPAGQAAPTPDAPVPVDIPGAASAATASLEPSGAADTASLPLGPPASLAPPGVPQPQPLPTAPSLPPIATASLANALLAHAGGSEAVRDWTQAFDAGGAARVEARTLALGAVAIEVARATDGLAITLGARTSEAQALLTDAQPRLVADARAAGLALAQSRVEDAPHGDRRGGARAPRPRLAVLNSTATAPSAPPADRYA